MKNNKGKSLWFKALKGFLKIFVRKPKIKYLGQKIEENSIVLSNHVGSKVPIKLELYADFAFRYWGTYEMNSDIKSVYKYLSNVYFYQKKHKGKFLSKFLGFVVAPFAKLFYKGMQLISTYPDARFKTTLQKSFTKIKEGYNLVIFPEDSSSGYFDNLKYFYGGFVVFANYCLKRGIDLNVYLSYYVKQTNTYIVDKPIKYSQLKQTFKDRQNIAEQMLKRVNALRQNDNKVNMC